MKMVKNMSTLRDDLAGIAAVKAAKGDFEARASDLNDRMQRKISDELVNKVNDECARMYRVRAIQRVKEQACSIVEEEACASQSDYSAAMTSILSAVRASIGDNPCSIITVPTSISTAVANEAEMKAFSGIGLVIFSFLSFIAWMLAVHSTNIIFGAFWWIVTVLLASVDIVFLFSGIFSLRGRTARTLSCAQRIKQFLGSDICRTVADISASINKSESRTLEILERIVSWKLFPDASIGAEGRVFFLSNYAKVEYEKRMSVYLKRLEQLTDAIANGTIPEDLNTLDLDASDVVLKCNRCTQKMLEKNSGIDNPNVSSRIISISNSLLSICIYVDKHREEETKLVQLMSYIVPTTLKMVESYSEMSYEGTDTPSIALTRKEIENALGELDHAYKNVLDKFHSSASMDIATDIEVLNAVIAQQGLTDSPFKEEAAIA